MFHCKFCGVDVQPLARDGFSICPTCDVEVEISESLAGIRKIIWQKTLLLTVEMSYSKSKYLKGKYDAFKEIWEEFGGDIKPSNKNGGNEQ